MVIASFALAAMQPTAAETVRVPVCRLVAARGEDVRFFLWADDAPGSVRISALPGSVWPSGTVVGTRPERETGSSFNLGGRNGLRLELSPQAQGQSQRAVTLFARENDRPIVPLAYGFCQEEQVTANPPEPASDRSLVGADNAAFDSEQWPTDCALLLSDGRRIRLQPTLQQDGSFRLSSADLWSGRPVTVRMRTSNSNRMTVGSFGEADTPQGVRVLFLDRTRASVLIRFQSLDDPALPGVSGYSICGIRRIERRPNR